MLVLYVKGDVFSGNSDVDYAVDDFAKGCEILILACRIDTINL